MQSSFSNLLLPKDILVVLSLYKFIELILIVNLVLIPFVIVEGNIEKAVKIGVIFIFNEVSIKPK